jgi:hypothetical protein
MAAQATEARRAFLRMRPDHLAIGEHVIVLVLPLAGRAEGVGAFEGEVDHLVVLGCDLVHIRSPQLRDEPHAENDFGPNKGATYAYKPH